MLLTFIFGKGASLAEVPACWASPEAGAAGAAAGLRFALAGALFSHASMAGVKGCRS